MKGDTYTYQTITLSDVSRIYMILICFCSCKKEKYTLKRKTNFIMNWVKDFTGSDPMCPLNNRLRKTSHVKMSNCRIKNGVNK